MSMEEKAFEDLKIQLKAGRFPKNSNEIVISTQINSVAKLGLKIGDRLELNVGERVSTDDYELKDNNTYIQEEEKIVNPTQYSFEIVGIIERPGVSIEGYGEVGYTALSTGIESEDTNLYISLKEPRKYEEIIPQLLGLDDYNQVQNHDYEKAKYEFEENRELLRWEVFAFSDSTIAMIYSVIGVVLGIILFTSVFCIRNSFAIAVTEKIKTYSMLASVGTTKKQIRKNVITESLFLGIIGIPLGILSGFFAVFILLKIVNMLIGEYLLSHVDGIVFKVSIIPIIISIVLGIVTIYLSARSSARKASKISPIEGLRNSNDIKIKGRKLRTPKIISKIFKTGGVLAYKNLKRSKKKYRTTVISISVSIFVFIAMNAFVTNAFEVSNRYYFEEDYNILISTNEASEPSKEELNKITSLSSIEKYSLIYGLKDLDFKISDLSKVSKDVDIDLLSGVYYNEEDRNKIVHVSMPIKALNQEAFKRYANEIGLKYEDVKDTGILCDEFLKYDREANNSKLVRTYTYSKGDVIKGEYNNKEVAIKVGAVSKIKPDGMKRVDYSGGILVIEKDAISDFDYYLSETVIKSSDPDVLEKEISKISENVYIYNAEEALREERAMVLVIKIFLYGFITVITLIGVTNIFNTITSNMELRQKEFATLKSIGMTKKEFNRMINLETIFYGVKSWIYGTIMGLMGTLAMYKAFGVKMDLGMYIPINAIIISAIFVFAFVFMIMKYSMTKINKQNTVETIRNENI